MLPCACVPPVHTHPRSFKWAFSRDACDSTYWYISNLASGQNADIMCLAGVKLSEGIMPTNYAVQVSQVFLFQQGGAGHGRAVG